MRRLLFIVAALVLAACGQTSSDQVGTNDGGATTAPGSSAAAAPTPEGDVLRTVAMYEGYQAQASAIAAERAQTRAVRDFAAARAAANDAGGAAVAEAARAAHVAAPDGALDENHQAYLAMLRDAGPAQFDAIYASQQSLMHMSVIGALEQYLTARPQSALTPWANVKLAEVRSGLEAARALRP